MLERNGDAKVSVQNQHLLTVVIPNHNYGRYLGRAIDSVIAQDYASIELIVIDDGSDDDSLDVVRTRLAGQTRLKRGYVIALEHNRGKLGALNAGMNDINGEYLITLDADDWLAPNYASRCISELRSRRLRDPSLGFVYTDCNLVDEYEAPIDRGRSVAFDYELVGRSSFLPEPAVMLASAFKQAAPFDESIRVATKHHKWCRVVANGWTGYHIAEPLFFYRMHEHNLSGIGQRIMAETQNGEHSERILSGYWQVARG